MRHRTLSSKWLITDLNILTTSNANRRNIPARWPVISRADLLEWFFFSLAHLTNKCVLSVPSGKGSIIPSLYLSFCSLSTFLYAAVDEWRRHLVTTGSFLSLGALFTSDCRCRRKKKRRRHAEAKNHRPSKKSSEIEFLIFLLLDPPQTAAIDWWREQIVFFFQLPRTRSPALKWSCRIVKIHLIGADVRPASARVIHSAHFCSIFKETLFRVPGPLKKKEENFTQKNDWKILKIQWIDVLLNLKSTNLFVDGI